MRNIIAFWMFIILAAIVLSSSAMAIHSSPLDDNADTSPISASDAYAIATHATKARLDAEAPELLERAYAAIHEAILNGEVSTNVSVQSLHDESIRKTTTALIRHGYTVTGNDTLNGGKFLTISWDHE